MDANGVSRLARSRLAPGSRRSLLAAALAGLLTVAGGEAAVSANRARKKKRSHKKSGDESPPECNLECDDLSCAHCAPAPAR